MNFLVCISRTPDTTSKITFEADSRKLKEDGLVFILNPYDEWYALVRAIELSEQHGGTVTVINIGNASNDIIIRKALAIGELTLSRIHHGKSPNTSQILRKQRPMILFYWEKRQ